MTARYPEGAFPTSDSLYNDMDPGIRDYAKALRDGGIETCQSCEGGAGHAYTWPTVDFIGDQADGWLAVHVAIEAGLPIRLLKRQWMFEKGEPTEVVWQMMFQPPPGGYVRQFGKRYPEPSLSSNVVIRFEDNALPLMNIEDARLFAKEIIAACDSAVEEDE